MFATLFALWGVRGTKIPMILYILALAHLDFVRIKSIVIFRVF